MRPSLRRVSVAVAIAVGLLATRAEAHTMVSPDSPFAGGLKHFLFSIEDILIAIAAGIFAAEHGGKFAVRGVAVLAAAWLAGGLGGLAIGSLPAAADRAAAGTLLIVGLLAAWDRRFGPGVVMAVVAVAGGVHGLLNGVGMQAPGFRAGVFQLLGIGSAVAFVSFYPTVLLELVQKPWARVVARILGSWIAATGLLMLGWAFRSAR
ncbi:MAG: HupE/UreJ family protein [Verrucomicrobia bacterium]|jgi:hydrogenase/urease accessory protein HupE|nr:HupE/UreJ family protein [Verrucomicrobiota bacterium]